MIQFRTMINVADNTGARKMQVIRLSRGYKRRYSSVGDIVTCVVKEATPHMPVKDGEIVHAVIVRIKKEIRRFDGSYIRFDDNAGVIIDEKTKEPKGTRIFGPVARELKEKGFLKICSLAPEVL